MLSDSKTLQPPIRNYWPDTKDWVSAKKYTPPDGSLVRVLTSTNWDYDAVFFKEYENQNGETFSDVFVKSVRRTIRKNAKILDVKCWRRPGTPEKEEAPDFRLYDTLNDWRDEIILRQHYIDRIYELMKDGTDLETTKREAALLIEQVHKQHSSFITKIDKMKDHVLKEMREE